MFVRFSTTASIIVSFCLLCGPSSFAAEGINSPWNDQAARSVAHYIMGIKHDLWGNTKDAVREYEQAASFDASVFATRLRLGSNYARLGNFPGAIRELNAATWLDPEDLQSRYFLALVYSATHDFNKAAQEYETILKKLATKDPRNAELYMYLGQLYFSQNKPEKAVEQYEKVLELDRKNTTAMFLVGSYYLDHGRRAEAVKLFTQCLDNDPLDAGCMNSLGYTYAEDNIKLDEAEKLITGALEVEPENGAYVDSLGWVYYRQGRYTDALRELLRADGLIADPVIREHLADVYIKLDQPDLAKKYWRMSLEQDPSQYSVRAKLEALEKGQALKRP